MHQLHLHGVLDQVLHIAPRHLLAKEDVLLLVFFGVLFDILPVILGVFVLVAVVLVACSGLVKFGQLLIDQSELFHGVQLKGHALLPDGNPHLDAVSHEWVLNVELFNHSGAVERLGELLETHTLDVVSESCDFLLFL